MLCSVAWMYVHVIVLPGCIKDALWYRAPLHKYSCELNQAEQPQWSLGVHIAVSDMSLIVMLLGYGIISWKLCSRLRKRLSTQVIFEQGIVNHSTKKHTGPTLKQSHGFMLLTALTISVSICWSPDLIYLTVGYFIHIDDQWYGEAFEALFGMQPVLDPFLFASALGDVRTEIVRLVGLRSNCFLRVLSRNVPSVA